MATGRTVNKYVRAYVDGYDMSGYAVSVGSLNYGYDQNDIIALSDAVIGALPGKGSISIGNINGIMDNTATSGMHVLFSSASDAVRDVMIPVGIRAVPASGRSSADRSWSSVRKGGPRRCGRASGRASCR